MEKSVEKSKLKSGVKARSSNDASTSASTTTEPEVSTDNSQRKYDLKYMDYQKSLYLRVKTKKALQKIQNDTQMQLLGMNELMEKLRKENAELHYAVGCMKMLQKLEETTPKMEGILYPLTGELDASGKKLEDIEAACSAASHIMPKQLQEYLTKLDYSEITAIQTALNEINKTMCIERVDDLEATAKAIQNVSANSKKLVEETTKSKELLQEADELFEEETSLIFDLLM